MVAFQPILFFVFCVTCSDVSVWVSLWDSRGLTAAELFGSWTRWPCLPDASLTQGQNPEWKPLMFFDWLPTLLLLLSRSLSPFLCVARSLSPLSFSSLSLHSTVSSPLPLWFTLSSSQLRSSSDPFPHRNQGWQKAGLLSLWTSLVQNYVTFSERCGVQKFSEDSTNLFQLQLHMHGVWKN